MRLINVFLDFLISDVFIKNEYNDLIIGDVVTIVEFLPAGDLLDYLRKSRKYATEHGVSSNLTEADFLNFACDITSGMVHLAEHNVSDSTTIGFKVMLSYMRSA